MRLIYFEDPHGNVGDQLNPWLWPTILKQNFQSDSDLGFLGIGSILTENYIRQTARGIIFGSGIRHPSKVPLLDRSAWAIRFVRGPLSSKALGGVPHITDPAALAPLVYEGGRFAAGFCNGREIGYVRYFKSPRTHARDVCTRLGLRDIDPSLPPDAFLKELSACRLVITEAMHGAILADAFRIPWVGVRAYSDVIEGRVAAFKWEDWLQSMELPRTAAPPSRLLSYTPLRLRTRLLKPVAIDTMARHIEQAIEDGAGTLSSSAILENRQALLLEQVEAIRSEGM